MEKPIGFELLEVGNEYEFIMKNRYKYFIR